MKEKVTIETLGFAYNTMMSEYNFETELDILRLGKLNFIKRKEFTTLYNFFLIGLWGLALDEIHPEHSNSIFNFYKNFMKDSLNEAKLPGADMVETIDYYYGILKENFVVGCSYLATEFVLKYSKHQQSAPTQKDDLTKQFLVMYEILLGFCKDHEIIQEKVVIPCPICSQQLRIPSNKKIKVTCNRCGHIFTGSF